MADRILVYDCFSGISGDMHIGAMLDVGVPEDMLRGELARLPVADEFHLLVERDTKLGISGTRATVRVAPDVPKPHRHLSTITAIVRDAGYSTAVETRALAIFGHIARAEALIHGIDIEAVHFHEVGATDSIVDIVAAAICLEHLNVQATFCAEVEVGSGTLRCEHGVMPVPAPATAEILTGVPCHHGRVTGEATTPTGAAILRNAVTKFAQPGTYTAQRIGYGVGQKDFEVANVLRVTLGERAARDTTQREANTEIVCNVDDMSPEAFQPLLDALFAAGAKDAFLTPVIMKKSRPGTQITVLCAADTVDAATNILFEQSTTIGVRLRRVDKRMLPREEISVRTPVGNVRAKLVTLPDGTTRWKTEHDDVAALASGSGRSYLDVRALADDAVRTHLAATGDAPR